MLAPQRSSYSAGEGLSPKAVFFKGDLLQTVAVAKELREAALIVLELAWPRCSPTVFQIDAHQFAQHWQIERILERGKKIGDIDLSSARACRFISIHELVQLFAMRLHRFDGHLILP